MSSRRYVGLAGTELGRACAPMRGAIDNGALAAGFPAPASAA
jgi:hypothetical protein